MKSALDMLIEELEAGAWACTEISSRKAQPVESEHDITPGLSRPSASEPKQSQEGDPGECGSAHCAGCYDVGDGKKIHPPRCGKDYLDWFKRWEEKGGRVQ
jgi:hypothetical protein